MERRTVHNNMYPDTNSWESLCLSSLCASVCLRFMSLHLYVSISFTESEYQGNGKQNTGDFRAHASPFAFHSETWMLLNVEKKRKKKKKKKETITTLERKRERKKVHKVPSTNIIFQSESP